MFANARLTAVPGYLLRASRGIMLTRSQLSAIKNDLIVSQDKEAKIFYAQVGKKLAVIEYEESEDGKVLKLMHTKVPKELEGHGVGSKLAKETFDQIVRNDQKAKLVCEFLKHFLDKQGNKYGNHISYA